jgi:hypothetical protein
MIEAYNSSAPGKLKLSYTGLSTTVNLYVKLGGYGWKFTGNWYYYGGKLPPVRFSRALGIAALTQSLL